MQAETRQTTDPTAPCDRCPQRGDLLEEYVRGLIETAVGAREDAIRWRRVATLVVGVLVVVVVVAILGGCASSAGAKPEAVARVATWDNGAAAALEIAGETAWDVILRCSRAPGCEYTEARRGLVLEVVDVRRWRGREDVVEIEVPGRSPFGVHASRFDMITQRATAPGDSLPVE